MTGKRAGKKGGLRADLQAGAVGLGLLLLLFLLPLLLAGGRGEEEPGGAEETGQASALPLGRTVVEPPAREETAEEKGWDEETTVRVKLAEGRVEEMTMADYLWGVVAAEMPASFHPEALKAQAVAARTYTVSRMELGSQNHPEAHVCADIGCCQAWISPQAAREGWGEEGETWQEKIREAVAATDGMAAVYGGRPIQAVFFSSAAGRTVDAVEVWGNAVPYLSGVESPEGEEVPDYHSRVEIPLEEFRAAILAEAPQAVLGESPEDWLGETVYNSAGGVGSLEIGGVPFSGRTLRGLFDLRSVNFSVEMEGETAVFLVTGYGHGVGMSQYGANSLAREGKTWQEILKWYYSGIAIEDMKTW